MKDMSSEAFPRIPRPGEQLMNGWGTLVNKNGPEGVNAIIANALTPNATPVPAEEAPGEGPE